MKVQYYKSKFPPTDEPVFYTSLEGCFVQGRGNSKKKAFADLVEKINHLFNQVENIKRIATNHPSQ